MSATPSERRMQGQAAAHQSWANTVDRSARTAAGRRAALAKFDDSPDPESARKAHMKRLALKSAQARRKNR